MRTPHRWPARLPFYYGWLIVGIAFVTMAIAVTARTAFSLLLPPLIDEFGWDRGLAAGAFSFGFLVSAVLSPIVGRLMDSRGPRIVIEMRRVHGDGRVCCWRPGIEKPWHLYATLGVLVGGGANLMTFTAQSLFLPQLVRAPPGASPSASPSRASASAPSCCCRGCRSIIERDGWRASCWTMGLLVLLVLGPFNLFVRRRPQDIGLLPDGDRTPPALRRRAPRRTSSIAAWASVEWTLARAHPDRALLVDRARVLLRAGRLVCGAGAPDQVPDRGRLLAARGGLGAGDR